MFDINVSVLKSIPSIYLLVTKGLRPGDRLNMPEQGSKSIQWILQIAETEHVLSDMPHYQPRPVPYNWPVT